LCPLIVISRIINVCVPLSPSKNGNKARDGIEALADLDSNNDGVINSQDTEFSNIKIWQDQDQDGKLDAGELLTLAEAGVKSFNTAYTNSDAVDAQGNAHKQQGSFTTTDGTSNKMNDVWFEVDLAKTKETDLIEVSDEITKLPNLAGFGNVHSLHQAMARDESGELKTLVEQVISTNGGNKNKNISTLATNDTLASKQNLADNQPYYLEVA
jgi:hypothetical protein